MRGASEAFSWALPQTGWPVGAADSGAVVEDALPAGAVVEPPPDGALVLEEPAFGAVEEAAVLGAP